MSDTPNTQLALEISRDKYELATRMAEMERQIAAVTKERDEARAEVAELNRKLDVLLYDVDYKGGLQDWQGRAHKATMTAFETGMKLVEVAQKLAESESARDKLAQAILDAPHAVGCKLLRMVKPGYMRRPCDCWKASALKGAE